MPLFMDVRRNLEGLTADAVADAHRTRPRNPRRVWGQVHFFICCHCPRGI
jgi:hypothetical protein